MVNASPFSRQTRTTTGWWAKPRIVCVGIASTEIFGVAILSPHIHPEGIASAEAFGDMIFEYMQELTPAGIASVEAFGSPDVALGAEPTGIPSEEAFGTPTVAYQVEAAGIESAEAFGTAVLSTGVVDIAPVGIPSAEAFGTSVAVNEIWPTSIESVEVFGDAAISVGPVDISVPGIASTEAFGTTDVAPEAAYVTLTSGIDSAEAVGTLALSVGNVDVVPTAIDSVESIGTQEITPGNVDLAPTGIASAEAFGTAVLVIQQEVTLGTGIPSAEAFGTPVFSERFVGVTYSQSSLWPGLTAANYAGMNDNSALGSSGVNQTGCNGLAGGWIKADLGQVQYVSYIWIGYDYSNSLPGGWNPLYTESALVEGSADGYNWTTVTTTPSYASTGSSNGLVRLDINAPYRYIRLTKGSGYFCLLEFSNYGYIMETVSVAPTSIPSEEAFGTQEITTGNVNINPSLDTIESLEAFGTSVLSYTYDISGVGAIASAEAFGTPVLTTGSVDVSSVGAIASEEAFGTTELTVGEVIITPTAIASAETFGTQSIAGDEQYITPTGIASAEAFGTAVITQPVTSYMAAASVACYKAAYSGIVFNPTYPTNDNGNPHTVTSNSTTNPGLVIYGVGCAYGTTAPSFSGATRRQWRSESGARASAGAGEIQTTGGAKTISCTNNQWGSNFAIDATGSGGTPAYSSSAGAGTTGQQSSLTWTHSINSTDTLIVVVVSCYNASVETTMTCTMDGVAMTKRAYGSRCVAFTAANSTTRTATFVVNT